MVYVRNELREEFPESGARIDELTRLNCGFTKLAAEYEFLNREIYLIESRMNLASIEELEEFKQQRAKVKKRIIGCLNGEHSDEC